MTPNPTVLDLAAVVPGDGRDMALDLGGADGRLAAAVAGHGYRYVDLDMHYDATGVIGDAQRLPFTDASFALVLSVDTLEHFPDPHMACREVGRVLRPGGRFVVSVPFLHPFHSDDLWRYTPLGLELLMEQAGMVIEQLDPLGGVFTLLAHVSLQVLARLHLSRLAGLAVRLGEWLDRVAVRWFGQEGQAAAHSYLMVAAAK